MMSTGLDLFTHVSVCTYISSRKLSNKKGLLSWLVNSMCFLSEQSDAPFIFLFNNPDRTTNSCALVCYKNKKSGSVGMRFMTNKSQNRKR